MRRASGVTVEALEVVSSAIKIPLILGGGSSQLGDLDWLAAHRVRVALQTHAPFSGRGAGGLRQAERTERGCAAARTQEHRPARADAAGHPG